MNKLFYRTMGKLHAVNAVALSAADANAHCARSNDAVIAELDGLLCNGGKLVILSDAKDAGIKPEAEAAPVVRTVPLFKAIASTLLARQNCAARMEESNGTNGAFWYHKHTDSIEALVKEHMPSGSGFDSGTKLDYDKSTPEKLVFNTSYHHMQDDYYCGWTDHTVTVRASLWATYDFKISGRNVNEIKDYIADVFSGLSDVEVSQ